MREEQVRPSGVRLTWTDLMQWPDDGLRHEIIDGEHLVTAAPVRKHQMIVRELGGLIWQYLREHPIGEVFAAPMDVIFTPHDVVEPDIIYYSHERAKSFEPSPWVHGVPNLAVEVLSPGTCIRDLTVKRTLYERFGVDEYWMVDPDDESIEVLRREGEVYVVVGLLRRHADDVLTTPLLPGLRMSLGDVFGS